MYKVLIADDEKIVIDTLQRLIPWDELGLAVVATAENGADAYLAVLDLSPDIIITDIKMPLLSGLALIERIRALDNDSEIIILSGFGEFSYAQEAIRYRVSQYLIKPTRRDELIAVLRDCVRTLDDRSGERKRARTELLRRFQFHIAKAQISDMVEHIDRFDEIDPLASDELALQGTGPVMLMQIKVKGEPHLRTMALSVRKQLEAFRLSAAIPLIFSEDSFFILIDSSSAGDADRFEEALRSSSLDLEITRRAGDVKDMLFELVSCIYASRAIYIFDDASRSEQLINKSSGFNRLKVLLSIQERLGEERIRDEVISIFQDCSIAEARALVIMLYSLVQDNEASLSLLTLARDMKDKDEAIDYAIRLIDAGSVSESESYPVRTLKAYLREHISDEAISLKYIAENVLMMNVGYLSRLFVKETGTKFSEYLNSMRIDKAKNLLDVYPGMSIAEIAEHVGFADNPRYFSQVFKKYAGMTPSEWARRRD